MTRIIILLVAAILVQVAAAEPDRESLVEAWEAYVAALPGTSAFEVIGEGVYRLQDADLPYDGEVKLVGALVRSAEAAGIDTGFTSLGMVDFELVDIPDERLASGSRRKVTTIGFPTVKPCITRTPSSVGWVQLIIRPPLLSCIPAEHRSVRCHSC
jgi:hypothetical protein